MINRAEQRLQRSTHIYINNCFSTKTQRHFRKGGSFHKTVAKTIKYLLQNRRKISLQYIYHEFNYVPLSIHMLGTSLVVQCNEPCNAEDMGSIPGQGTKIPYAEEQSPHTTITESTCHKRSLCATTKISHDTTKTQHIK